MVRQKWLWAAFMALFMAGAATAANGHSAAEQVRLKPSCLGIPCGQEGIVAATLYKPKGKGPFPAVVIQHGCGGVNKEQDIAWVERLTAWGYVALVVDSFSLRNRPNGQCELPAPQLVYSSFRAADAYAGLSYLRSLDFVRGESIGLLGFSDGGASVLQASADHSPSKVMAKEAAGPFAGAIALYPACGFDVGNWRVHRENGPVKMYFGKYTPLQPLLILIGELDDWTPAVHCERLVEKAKSELLAMKIYPGAHHAFDASWKLQTYEKALTLEKPGRCCGATHGHNAKALARALEDVKSFFDLHLNSAK